MQNVCFGMRISTLDYFGFDLAVRRSIKRFFY